MTERVAPIRAEILASKIEKLENFELPELFDEFSAEPRLIRALWFLQFVSWPKNYTGGLTKFAADFIAASSDKLGTVHMAKRPKGELFDLPQAVEVLREFACDQRDELLGVDSDLFQEAFLPKPHFDDWGSPCIGRLALSTRSSRRHSAGQSLGRTADPVAKSGNDNSWPRWLPSVFASFARKLRETLLPII